MLFLSDEHMQHGLTDPWWPAMSVMWCEDWEVYHEWRERVCSGAVLATALAVTALGAPRLWRRQETGLSHTRSNSWDGDTRTPHIGPWSSGALTSGHWTRGHVSRQPAAGNLPVRGRRAPWQPLWTLSETLSAPVRVLSSSCWLTDSNSSLRSGHNCHHCGVRVRYQHHQWAVTVWTQSKQNFQRLLTFQDYQGSNLSRVQLKIWRYIIQIKLLSVNSRWRCRSQVENLNDIETLKLTNFLPWTPRSPVGTWVTWWTTTETSPTSPSTRPRSSASAKMPGSFPTCRSVHFISIHFPLQLYSEHSHSFIRCKQAIHTVIEYPKFVHEHLGKPLGLYWTLSFADTNSGVRVNWGLEKITCSVTVRGDAASIFTMKLFVSNVRTHNRCELLCCLIMTNKLNVLMSLRHCLGKA